MVPNFLLSVAFYIIAMFMGHQFSNPRTLKDISPTESQKLFVVIEIKSAGKAKQLPAMIIHGLAI